MYPRRKEFLFLVQHQRASEEPEALGLKARDWVPPAIQRAGCGGARSSAPGERDKYRYEVECVTDVPIGCILSR
jgi:hypothetical protein